MTPDPDSNAAGNSKAALRILLAEDNFLNQSVTRLQLEKLGYRAAIVGDGVAALEFVMTQPVDVVLMDCHMPRLDGFEATRRLREWEAALRKAGDQREPIHIIALTASALPGDRALCLAAGMNAYLSKPLRTAELAAALAGAARQGTSGA